MSEYTEPTTLAEAMEILADLEYEISLLENELNDLKDEVKGMTRELEDANEIIFELEAELNG